MIQLRHIPFLFSIGCASAQQMQQVQDAVPQCAAEALPPSTVQFRVNAHRDGQVTIPEGWAARVQPLKPNQAIQLEAFSMDGLHKLKITLLVAQGKAMEQPSPAKMGAMVEAVLAPKINRSVEGKVNLQKLRVDGADGFYATITDKELVGGTGKLPRGSWRRFTVGNSTHDGFLAAVTAYSNGQTDPGLAVWNSLKSVAHSPVLPKMALGPVVLCAPAGLKVEVLRRSEQVSKVTAHTGSFGFNMTVDTFKVKAETPDSAWCQEDYSRRLTASLEGNAKARIDPASVRVLDRGAFVQRRHHILGRASPTQTVRVPNVFNFLGGKGHCTVVHLSILPVTQANVILLEQVAKSISVATATPAD